jgi:NAD(P)-dependent dehydrogenase (short-subunit alcohol dehydrogenase family)
MIPRRKVKMNLKGKVVVITGAGNGMGRQMTLDALARGASVFGVDLNEDALKATAELAPKGSKFAYATANIADRDRVAKLPAEVEAALGAADILVNNAGIIQPFVRVNDLDFAAIDRVMAVNFDGPVNMVKAFLPGLLARPAAQIANVSSMGAYAPVPGQTIYGASKAAVKLFTEGLRSELFGTSVKVTLIFPGAIATNIAGNSGIAMDMDAASADASKFKTTPVETAGKIMIDAIERELPRVFVGSDASMMDKMARLMPVKVAEIIYKQMKDLLK